MPYKKRLSDFKSDFTFGGVNKHFVSTASRCHPPPYQPLFSLQSRGEAACGRREWTDTGRANTLVVLHLGTQWENYPVSHSRHSVRVFIFFYKVDSVTPK